MLNRRFVFISVFTFVMFALMAIGRPVLADTENGYTMGLGCIYPSDGESVHLSMATHGEDQSEKNVVSEVVGELMKPVNVLGVINNSILAFAGVGGEALEGDRSENVMCNSFPVGDMETQMTFRIGESADTRSIAARGAGTQVAVNGPVKIEFERNKARGSGE